MDLREALRPQPELVGALTAEAALTPIGRTTTEIRSSLLRFRDDEDDTVAESDLRATGARTEPLAFERPAPEADSEGSGPDPDVRQVWPEIRFYLGCAALFFVTFALATGLWVLAPAMVFGWSSAAITSGSMEPAVRVGDVVVYSAPPVETIGTGTVIVFDDGSGSLVTHRIVGYDGGSYITQGDNNPVRDSRPVPPDDVRGVGRLLVPYAGYPAVWMSSGSVVSVLAVAAGFGLLVFASRWALLPSFIPWPRQQ